MLTVCLSSVLVDVHCGVFWVQPVTCRQWLNLSHCTMRLIQCLHPWTSWRHASSCRYVMYVEEILMIWYFPETRKLMLCSPLPRGSFHRCIQEARWVMNEFLHPVMTLLFGMLQQKQYWSPSTLSDDTITLEVTVDKNMLLPWVSLEWVVCLLPEQHVHLSESHLFIKFVYG